MAKKTYRNPVPTVDIIIEAKDQSGRPGIVLIKRRNPPEGWALPGGFVDYGESVENAAFREAEEETSMVVKNLEQFHVYSDPSRDPRGHTVTVVFTGDGEGELKAKDDARNAKIFTKGNLPDKIPFDHRKILEDYFEKNKT